MKKTFICPICQKKFERYLSTIRPDQQNVFCSVKHKNEFFKNLMKGTNNPNYGNKWSDSKKLEQSRKILEKYKDNPVYRYSVGKSNRGKKLSKETIQKMHMNRTFSSYSRPHTQKSKRLIAEKSKSKFTKEYMARFRKTMEDRGLWTRLEDKPDKDIYYKQSNWILKMWDLIKDRNQLLLLETFGIFNSRNNSHGVVRDHIYSRMDGFNNKVFPEILRHPCNCQIITHSKNASKRNGRYIDKSNITLDELFDKIENYPYDWIEQDLVIQKIKEYRNGNRWSRT